MNLSLIRILGQIDKILKENENGSATILFKIEPNLNLNKSIVMVDLTKKQWEKIKVVQDKEKMTISIHGQYEIRLKNNKPFIYVKCENLRKIKSKNIEKEKEKIELISNEEEIKSSKPKKKKLVKKVEPKINWSEFIPKEEFKEIDINKVKLVEEIHLSSRISIFDIKKMSQNEELKPIAVREVDNGEYALVAGIRSFIVGKLFSKNMKAYLTELTREEFKEKYSLEK